MKLFHFDDGHGLIWHAIDAYANWTVTREKRKVNKKIYMRLMILGAFGIHRFYAHKYITGVIYLLTCWSGFSSAMTLCDAIQAAPMQKDEDGCIIL